MPHAPVLVFGAGGHGRVVCEVVLAAGYRVDGFVDDGVPAGTRVLGLPVLGDAAWLAAQPPRSIALGLGNNSRREVVVAALRAQGHSVPCFVHPAAWVSPSAALGEATVVMARAVVNAEARVGTGVILNTGCIVEHECVVGDFAHLSPAAALGGGAIIGARSHIGINATLLQLTKVGADSTVGGGAVVLKEVPAGVTVVGVPARPLAK